MKSIKHFLLLLFVLFASSAMGQNLTLNNGVIKLKVDLNSGGAISYLSDAGNSYNVVNTHDQGRFIQQSYYNGQHIDRRASGQHPTYSPWNWNPIQAGDVYGNRAQLISHSVSSSQIYVKTRPKLWDMNNELCECYFETWITLEGSAAKVRNRLTTFQTDNIWTPRAYHQELPAVYTRGDLYKLYSYRGSAPWTGGSLSRINNSGPPWTYWDANERWSALVNSNDWGVGVYNANSVLTVGGFSGSQGGGPTGNSTGYFSPLRTIQLSKNGSFTYEYYLILGNLTDIRNFVYNKRGISTGGGTGGGGTTSNSLKWEFNSTGNAQNWRRGGGTGTLAVSGGRLKVPATQIDPQIRHYRSINPRLFDFLKIGMSNSTNNADMDFFWANSQGGFSGSRRRRVTVAPNSSQREYTFDLRNVSGWKNGGTVTALRIDPPGDGSPSGEYVQIDYIRLTGTGTTKTLYGPEEEEATTATAIGDQLGLSLVDNSISVFPNPFHDELNVLTSEPAVALYNLQGKRMKLPVNKTDKGFKVNGENLPAGLYVLKIGDKVMKVKKE